MSEELNEISKGRLGKYVKKAKRDLIGASLGWGRHSSNRPGDYQRYAHRSKGIDDAVDKLVKETVQIDEISKKKLGKYINSAAVDMAQRSRDNERESVKASMSREPHDPKIDNREYGIAKAVRKITKTKIKENVQPRESTGRYTKNQNILSTAYEAKPVEFNAIFNDKVIDRIGALVNAKRVELGQQYLKNEPIENKEVK